MNPTNSLTPEVEIHITSLAHGGSGVGRHDDFVIFVPFTVPGDKVRARIVSTKKNYAEGALVEVLEPSPHRIMAPCPVFGTCGGCQWQHVNYQEQLHQKQLIVEHALARMARETGAKILPIVPSPRPFHYRNRLQVRAEGPRVGFYQRNTHNIVEFNECLIAEAPLNEEIRKIKEERPDAPDFKTSKIEIFMSTGKNGQAPEPVRSLNKAHGEEFGFSQVNTAQNENMIASICQFLGSPAQVDEDNVGARGNLLDLYCGNGNFSLPLNRLGWRIYGVDANRSAVAWARKQATPSTFFSVADCSWEVKKLAEKKRRFEVILLDPPRVGAGEDLWPSLEKLEAQKMVYVSCNPATFARDWARIKNKTGFELIHILPFDMFPQTFHVELVAFARRLTSK